MAKMIPDAIGENTASVAEKKVFSIFANAEGTESWTVLHSVGISKHVKQTQGEADFVVIAPSLGIFVLEVKGGGISCEDGKWFSVDRNEEKHPIKNPQTEANEAMQSLMKYIEGHKDNTQKLHYALFGYAVVFPDTCFHSESVPELADDIIIDKSDLSDIISAVRRISKHWSANISRNIFIPELAECRKIRNCLRPNFDTKIPMLARIQSIEERIIKLTEQQEMVFQGLTSNDRCIVNGTAGSGKTMMAVNYAQMQLEEGNRVGLFCYNKKLASSLKSKIDDSLLTCGSFTEYMVSVAEKSFPDVVAEETANGGSDQFYYKALPKLFCDAFIDQELPSLDVLILDEAQDLFSEDIMAAFDLILSGGLKNGKWFFFMDGEKQNLYHSKTSVQHMVQLLKDNDIQSTSYSLSLNCRNSKAIVEKISSVFNTNIKAGVTNDIRGTDVETFACRDQEEETGKLKEILAKLESEYIPNESIAILSAYRLERSAARDLDKNLISEDVLNHKGKILFSTIQGFKGLESQIVILTDINALKYEDQINMLYIGMTRAREMLYMLVSPEVKKIIG